MDGDLQSIVERMVRAGESEENIALVIQHYAPQKTATPPPAAATRGMEPPSHMDPTTGVPQPFAGLGIRSIPDAEWRTMGFGQKVRALGDAAGKMAAGVLDMPSAAPDTKPFQASVRDAQEHPIATAIAFGATPAAMALKPYYPAMIRGAATTLEQPVVGGVIGGAEGYKRGGAMGGIEGALIGAAGGFGLAKLLRQYAGRVEGVPTASVSDQVAESIRHVTEGSSGNDLAALYRSLQNKTVLTPLEQQILDRLEPMIRSTASNIGRSWNVGGKGQ